MMRLRRRPTDVKTKAGTVAKSKAKISHCDGMQAIVAEFGDSKVRLLHFCTDQSSDGIADAELYFRVVWESFRPCYDIWHKVKEFTGLWKTFCSRRICPRGMLINLVNSIASCSFSLSIVLYSFSGAFAHKELQFLFSEDLLPAHKFKIHFEYCCGTCTQKRMKIERVEMFQELWIGAVDHYVSKWTKKWMKKYIRTFKGIVLTPLLLYVVPLWLC
jgi:hypothetical protein